MSEFAEGIVLIIRLILANSSLCYFRCGETPAFRSTQVSNFRFMH